MEGDKLSDEEEAKLLGTLLETTSLTPAIARLRRKLIIRQVKRRKKLGVFDLDQFMVNATSQKRKHEQRVSFYLYADKDDPYAHIKEEGAPAKRARRDTRAVPDHSVTEHTETREQVEPEEAKPFKPSAERFKERLMGTAFGRRGQEDSIVSPFSLRKLMPYIRRDETSRPKRLMLLEELYRSPLFLRCLQAASKGRTTKGPQIAPIDYTYLRPCLVQRVNQFLCEYFWPDIDISEHLQYPDFSVVVLYKQLVIGCAMMTPEAYITYIAVHPEWRRAGISLFMMYHLLQTCPTKDITLHVSATNEAVLMYQRLGFKPEQYLLGFYNKYLPEDSTQCHHALFMRLRR